MTKKKSSAEKTEWQKNFDAKQKEAKEKLAKAAELNRQRDEKKRLAAEKKAASLPPKLTVPMIMFFLPVLFAVIMTPAIIQIMEG